MIVIPNGDGDFIVCNNSNRKYE